jgi:large subunit ribosomal protein L30
VAEQRTAPGAEAASARARAGTQGNTPAQGNTRGAADSTSTPRRASTQSAAPAATAPGRLRLQLVRSPIGTTERQRATVRALGLRRLRQVVEQPDSPVTRGMIGKVSHLVTILDQQE